MSEMKQNISNLVIGGRCGAVVGLAISILVFDWPINLGPNAANGKEPQTREEILWKQLREECPEFFSWPEGIAKDYCFELSKRWAEERQKERLKETKIYRDRIIEKLQREGKLNGNISTNVTNPDAGSSVED